MFVLRVFGFEPLQSATSLEDGVPGLAAFAEHEILVCSNEFRCKDIEPFFGELKRLDESLMLIPALHNLMSHVFLYVCNAVAAIIVFDVDVNGVFDSWRAIAMLGEDQSPSGE